MSAVVMTGREVVMVFYSLSFCIFSEFSACTGINFISRKSH